MKNLELKVGTFRYSTIGRIQNIKYPDELVSLSGRRSDWSGLEPAGRPGLT